MLCAHLHAFSRDSPLSCIQINLGPFSFAKFARPNKGERSKLQGAAGDEGALVGLDSVEEGADLIADNIRALGFKLTDVRYLLHSHEHLDHVGGIARLQQLTAARLVASAPAAEVFRTGTAPGDDPQAGMHPPFPAAKVDRVIGDKRPFNRRFDPGHPAADESGYDPTNGAGDRDDADSYTRAFTACMEGRNYVVK